MMMDIVLANEATADRIMEKASHCIIINNNFGGYSLKTSYDNTLTQGLIKNVAGVMVSAARSAVRDIDPTDDLFYMRMMTKKFEYLIAPEREFTIIVQQTHHT